MIDANTGCGTFSINDLEFEIEKQADGTYWLKWWKTPGASARVGVFANAIIAMFCAESFDPAKFNPADQHGQFRFMEPA